MCILKDLITHKESFPCYDHTRVNDIIGINKIHELRNFLPVVVRAVSVCSRFFFHNAITHTHTRFLVQDGERMYKGKSSFLKSSHANRRHNKT